MGGFDALYKKAVENSKAEAEAHKPKVTTTETDKNTGKKVTVTKDAPTKDEFYKEVAKRQVETGQGIGAKGNLQYTNTSEGHKIAVAAEKQGLHVGNVRKEATREAEIKNQARNELITEQAKANGPLTAGQRNPDGSRVTSVSGRRPQEPTQSEIDQRSAEIAQRGGVNKHVVDKLVADAARNPSYYNSQEAEAKSRAAANANQSQVQIYKETIVGGPPQGYDQLNEQQKKTYDGLKNGSPATAAYFLAQATTPKAQDIKASRGALGPNIASQLAEVEKANPGYKYAGSYKVDPNTGVISFNLYNQADAKKYHDEFMQYKKDLFEAGQTKAKIEANTKADNEKLRAIADRSGYALNQTVTVGTDGSKTTQNEFIVKPQVPDEERYGIEWIDANGKTEEQVKSERQRVKDEANASGYIVNENKLSNGSFVIEKIPKGPEAEGPMTIQGFGEVLYRGFVGSAGETAAGVVDLYQYSPTLSAEDKAKAANLAGDIRKVTHVDKEGVYGPISAGVLAAKAAAGDVDAQKELVHQKERLEHSPAARAELIVASGFDVLTLGGAAGIKAGITGVKEGALAAAKFATKAGEKEAVKGVEQAGKLAGTVGSEGLKNPEVIKLGANGQPLKSVAGVPVAPKTFNIGGKTISVNLPSKTKLYEVVENVGETETKGGKVATTKETVGFFNPSSDTVSLGRQAGSVEDKLLSVGQGPAYGSKTVEGAIEAGKPAVQPEIALTEGELGKVGSIPKSEGGTFAKENTTYVESNRPKISSTQSKAYAEKGGATVEDINLGVPKTEEVPFGTRGFGKDLRQSLTSDAQQSRIERSVPQSTQAESIREQAVTQSLDYIPKPQSTTQAAEYTRYIEESPEIRMKIQKQDRLMGTAKKDLAEVDKEIVKQEDEVRGLDEALQRIPENAPGREQAVNAINAARQRLVSLQAKKETLTNKITNARAKAAITREDVLSAIQRGQTKARDVEGKDVPFFEKGFAEKKAAAPGLTIPSEKFAQKFEVLTYERAGLTKAANDEAKAVAKASTKPTEPGQTPKLKRAMTLEKEAEPGVPSMTAKDFEELFPTKGGSKLIQVKKAEEGASKARASSEEARAATVGESLAQPGVEGGFKLINTVKEAGTFGIGGATGVEKVRGKKVKITDETTFVRYPDEAKEPKMFEGTKLDLITKPGHGAGFEGGFKLPTDLKNVPGFDDKSKTVPGDKTGIDQGNSFITIPGQGEGTIFDHGHDSGLTTTPKVDVPTIPKTTPTIPIETQIKIPEVIIPGWPGGGKVGPGGGRGSDSAVGLKGHDVANILFPALSITGGKGKGGKKKKQDLLI